MAGTEGGKDSTGPSGTTGRGWTERATERGENDGPSGKGGKMWPHLFF